LKQSANYAELEKFNCQ